MGDMRKMMYRAHTLGMTAEHYVFFHYASQVTVDLLQPWDYGTGVTPEERAWRMDAFRPMKLVSEQYLVYCQIIYILLRNTGHISSRVTPFSLTIW